MVFRAVSMFLVSLAGSSILAAEFQLADSSVLAVITHKGGYAKGLAHNHFIHAKGYQATVSASADDVESLSLHATIPSAELEADHPEVPAKWFEKVAALGIIDEPFTIHKEKDRKKITQSMLSKGQLNAAEYPEIQIKILTVTRKTGAFGGRQFDYEIKLAFTVRGVTREIAMPAAIQIEGDHLQIEAAATFKFSDFGIEPYSALLGAVSNQDECHLYANISAHAKDM